MREARHIISTKTDTQGIILNKNIGYNCGKNHILVKVRKKNTTQSFKCLDWGI